MKRVTRNNGFFENDSSDSEYRRIFKIERCGLNGKAKKIQVRKNKKVLEQWDFWQGAANDQPECIVRCMRIAN